MCELKDRLCDRRQERWSTKSDDVRRIARLERGKLQETLGDEAWRQSRDPVDRAAASESGAAASANQA